MVIIYIDKILELEQPLIPHILKLKVVEICQVKLTSYKDGILGELLLHWFRKKHLHLIMKVLQGFEFAKTRAINPISI